MHLRRVRIENVRSIRELEWEFEAGQEAGWHVVLGNNSTGKTALLQAIAYSIINFEWPEDLPHRWVRRGAKKAEILVTYTDNLEFSSRLGVNVRPSSPAQLRSIARERLSDPTTADREQRRVSFFSCGLGSMRRFGPRSYGECRQSNALFGPRSAASDV
ncbi:MAG TPA: AAA family ATPase, partial [Enhygromyxa sp.]|nr:AAA family ATPase [Enhygromyxa sp.]